MLRHLARLAAAALMLFALCTYGRSDGPASRPAVADLVRSLKQADGNGRAQAAAELGQRDDLDADGKDALRKALADENRAVRGRAAVALWRLDRPPLKDVLPGLLAARNDADESVRAAADEAWAEIGPGVRAAMPFVRKSLATDGQAMPKAIALRNVLPWRTRKLRWRSAWPTLRGSPATSRLPARNSGRRFSAP